MCVCVCVCVLSLSSPICLLVMVGGLYLLLFFSKPVQCGAPCPTSDYPMFRGSQRLGALFTGSVEIPVVLLAVVCVCVCEREREGGGGGGSNACSLCWLIYGHVENPCFLLLWGGCVCVCNVCGAPGPTINYPAFPETGGARKGGGVVRAQGGG